MDKRIARYTKVYGKAAAHAGISGKDAIVASFAKRIEEMYASGLLSMRSRHDEIIEKSYQKGDAS